MQNNIVYTIGVRDLASQGIGAVTDAVDNLRQSMGETLSALDKVRSAFNKFAEGAKIALDGVKGFSSGLSEVAKSLSDITQPSLDFEKSMRKANTMAQMGEEEFERYKGAIRDIAEEVPMARTALADGLYAVISAGVDKNNWVETLRVSARAAVGGCADLSRVIGVTQTVMKAYAEDGLTAADVQDKIQLTAQSGVTSFEEMAEALPRVSASASQLGISINELMSSFATLTGVSGNTAEVSTQLGAVFTALLKPSSEAAKLAEEMGIAFDSLSVQNAGGLQNFFRQLAADVNAYATKASMSTTEIYTQLFGSAQAARAILPITDSLAGKFVENTQALADASGTMDAAFLQMEGVGKQQTLGNWLDNVKDKIYDLVGSAVPYLNTLSGGLEQVVGMASGFNSLYDGVNNLKAAYTALAPSVIAACGSLASYVATSKLGVITTTAFKTVTALLKGEITLATFLTQAWAGAQELLNVALKANPIGVVVMAVAALGAAIYTCWQKFDEFRAGLLTAWETVKGFGNVLKTFIVDRITGIISGLGTIGAAIVALFDKDPGKAWELAKQGVKELTGFDATAKAIDGMKNEIDKIGETYDAKLEEEKKKKAAEEDAGTEKTDGKTGVEPDPITTAFTPNAATTAAATAAENTTGKGTANGVKEINITIDKLVESLTVQSQTIREGAGRIRDLVAQALAEAVNEAQLAM